MPNILIWDITAVQILLGEGVPNGGSARVFLYERRSRAVVIGDAFRSRLEAGLAAWAASMSATAICRPRAPPLGHELPADE